MRSRRSKGEQIADEVLQKFREEGTGADRRYEHLRED